MWHEARKQEKKIRSLMVDYKRRADRRREFYEKIKLDPAQFLRVYGRPAKIHWEHSVAIAAESPQSMMPWQGDNTIQIDRFDVRAHLDYIPEYKGASESQLRSDEEEEERHCNYERYKILVQNQCAGAAEEQVLHQIYVDEMFGSQAEQTRQKEKEEEKRKLAVKKAAIGYSYNEEKTEEGEADKEENDKDSDADSELDSDEDLDAVFDVDKITPEQTVALNVCGRSYGMAEDDFFEFLWNDKEEAEEIRMAKLMEEEKAQFSGRKSRRERRAYKEKKLAERGQLSPPSYAARASPTYEPYKRESSSSRSRSRSPERRAETRFITSFGGSDDEAAIVGPSLPPHLQPKSSKDAPRIRKSESPPHFTEIGSSAKQFKPVTKKRSSSTSSSSRSRSRTRSRSRSRSRTRSSRFRRRSRSYSRSRRGRPRRNSSRSRSRSYSVSRRFRTRSRSRSRRRYSRRSRSRSRSRSSRSRRRSRSRRSRSRSSRSSSSRSRSRSRSQEKAVITPFQKRKVSSSESDWDDGDEKDTQSPRSLNEEKSSGKKETAMNKKISFQEKMKKRMQKLVKQQYKADKKARQERQEKEHLERIEREEELRTMAVELRRKEREKRHKDREEIERMEKEEKLARRRSRSRSRSRTEKRSRSRDHERERPRRMDMNRPRPRPERSPRIRPLGSPPRSRIPKLVDY